MAPNPALVAKVNDIVNYIEKGNLPASQLKAKTTPMPTFMGDDLLDAQNYPQGALDAAFRIGHAIDHINNRDRVEAFVSFLGGNAANWATLKIATHRSGLGAHAGPMVYDTFIQDFIR